METEKTQGYYEGRMNYLIELFKNHEGEIINKNEDIVKKMISEYKNKFSDKPDYAKTSVGILGDLILN